MFRTLLYCIPLILVAGAAIGEEPAKKKESNDEKLVSGMSIVGNDEAPKSLVIVPWKSSELGYTVDVSRILDDGRQPVDKDVFMRELAYYQIRAATQQSHASGGR